MTEQWAQEALIGVDVGGTHTDVQVVHGERSARGKALTTHGDYSSGVLAAVEVAAGALGLGLGEVLADARLLVNATTVVTNVLTELAGARVGVLVTAGFSDTFRIAGGPRQALVDDHLQKNVPTIVGRRAVVEISERIDTGGSVLVPVDLDEVRDAVSYLVDEVSVDTLAICFLSSYQNPEHELAAMQVVSELRPDLFVSLSHELGRGRGETKRWTTAVLNSYVQPPTDAYLTSLARDLQAAGLTRAPAFFQGSGGAITRERAGRFPLLLLGSGPAGGVVGANVLATELGRRDILIGDMGGTSFDVAVLHDNEIPMSRDVRVGELQTGANLVDVVSIGAGGGSVVWVSDRGVPQAGPRSAGSRPGPACYGLGGTEPTVTDALVVLGLIDPQNYLGGRVSLAADPARRALEGFGSTFGWSAEDAAAAVYDLVVANMATAAREVSVGKGHDPRDFLFVAYGGTLPLFAAAIAAELGMRDVLVPADSSTFCAKGLLAARFVVRADRSLSASLSDPGGIVALNEVVDATVAEARDEMRREGFDDSMLDLAATAELRFAGQSSSLSISLPARPLTGDDVEPVLARFHDAYERAYGAGAAWSGQPVQIVSYSSAMSADIAAKPPPEGLSEPTTLAAATKVHRSVHAPSVGRRLTMPVLDDARFTPGTELEGPLVIDAGDTTIYVPPGTSIARDTKLDYWMRVEGDTQRGQS